MIFFCLNFLAATQDIAVDGWSLTLLSRENVGYASTCDTVGHLSGFFIGNAVFLGLTSADFSNRYLRTQPSEKGVVAFSEFFHFWGIVLLVSTTLIGLFKHEKSEQELHGEESIEGIVDGYKTLIQISRCPGILRFVPILLTFKVRSENNVLNNMRCSLQTGSRLGAQQQRSFFTRPLFVESLHSRTCSLLLACHVRVWLKGGPVHRPYILKLFFFILISFIRHCGSKNVFYEWEKTCMVFLICILEKLRNCPLLVR